MAEIRQSILQGQFPQYLKAARNRYAQ
jgi:hypothetical protein